MIILGSGLKVICRVTRAKYIPSLSNYILFKGSVIRLWLSLARKAVSSAVISPLKKTEKEAQPFRGGCVSGP